MNQTSENGEKTNFALFWPKLGPKRFFSWFLPYLMLYIVASYHCMEFQGKLMNQISENGKKPSLGPDFGPFGSNLGPYFFFMDFTSTRS